MREGDSAARMQKRNGIGDTNAPQPTHTSLPGSTTRHTTKLAMGLGVMRANIYTLAVGVDQGVYFMAGGQLHGR